MTNDLLAKAEALMNARERAWIGPLRATSSDGSRRHEIWDQNDDRVADGLSRPDAEFFALAANTSIDIIQGYQQLLKEKDALIQTLEEENEMLTESNEYLMQCEGERNDLRRLLRRAERVLSRLDQELGCNSAYLLSTREIVAQVVAEARAALPPEQHHDATVV